MTQTKVRMDFAQGIIEAEGSEEFVRFIYENFKENLGEISQTSAKKDKTVAKKTTKKKKSVRKSSGGKQSSSYTPSLVKDLDLKGGGKAKTSLGDFYKKFVPKSNMEKNLVFVYYLQEKAKLKSISVDHVFTCYRNIPKLKTPKALSQSLVDSANRKGWLDTSSLDSIKVPIAGINHIEHDMEKSSGKE